jgi:hypothetical protein
MTEIEAPVEEPIILDFIDKLLEIIIPRIKKLDLPISTLVNINSASKELVNLRDKQPEKYNKLGVEFEHKLLESLNTISKEVLEQIQKGE